MQPQTNTQLLSKTFIFEQEGTGKSDNLEISLETDLKMTNLKYVINIWKHKNSIKENLHFRIYDSILNRYVNFDLDAEDNQKYLYSSVVMFKYRDEGDSTYADDQIQSVNSFKDSALSRRQRNKQRSIQEVLRCVKQWRSLHNSLDKNRMKINLQQAAKIVGVSKKSLDDYYCQLRLAQHYAFDFHSNIHQNVGVLRTFVKQRRPKDDKSIKHQRLPKRLRILEEVEVEPKQGSQSLDDQNKPGQGQKIKIEAEAQPQTLIQAQYEPPMSIIPQDDYENRFYSSFDFKFDQPQDPFLSLGRKNVQKQLFSDSDQLLF